MIYNTTLNKFLSINKELTLQQKVELVETLGLGSLLDLMRNMEESQNEYELPVIQAVAKALLDNKIVLF